MNIKNLFNLSVIVILGFVLSGCANSQFAKKYNKPFKHNTPLIKSNDITKSGTVSYTHLTLPTNREV